MSYFKVHILGCGSATPTLRHNPSAQIVEYRDKLFLVDCGEGTQLQMRRYSIPYARISQIFISHIHGDHFLGLPGLLSTMSLHNIGSSITIHTFPEGIDILKKMLDIFCRDTSLQIHFRPLDPKQREVIFENNTLTVESFPLYHRTQCCGFIFREKPKPRHLDGAMAAFHAIPHWQIPAIKAGEDFITPDGRVIPNSVLTKDPGPQMSYAYCSDTAFSPQIARECAGTSVIYHEATYGDDNAALAPQRGHSTARQAAMTAAAAGASRLVIGHYSKRYPDSSVLVREALEEFPDVTAANEGMTIDII